jgi:hypothetical protein
MFFEYQIAYLLVTTGTKILSFPKRESKDKLILSSFLLQVLLVPRYSLPFALVPGVERANGSYKIA